MIFAYIFYQLTNQSHLAI